jgi:hypothetical protein
MSRRTTRTYHGGAANSGSGGSGHPSPFDRLIDQLGNVLLQGITNVVHLLTGKTITADQDLQINVVRNMIVAAVNANIASTNISEISGFHTNILAGTPTSGGNLLLSGYADVGVVCSVGPVSIVAGGDKINLIAIAGVFIPVIKAGATQAAAGAAADEVWKTNGHASLPNNVLMIGV